MSICESKLSIIDGSYGCLGFDPAITTELESSRDRVVHFIRKLMPFLSRVQTHVSLNRTPANSNNKPNR